jgi:2,4-dienoyl-CoA reductase-like NADH-dependent reductase (Old Yellow Enzyme family)
MHTLLEPWTIGTLPLRNRLWMAPVKTAFGTSEGRLTDRHLHFYRRVAEGGVGLLIIEPVPVLWEGREHPKQIAVTRPESPEDLAVIAAVIHQGGARAGLHLNHAGRAANPRAGGDPAAPTASPCPARGTQARELRASEIDAIIDAFGQAARVGAGAGFDMLEIQGGHGYLLQQFLDPKTNQRHDDFGTDHFLFARRVIQAVRGACSLPVSLRITVSNPADAAEHERLEALLSLAESLGIAVVHASMGDACTSPPWYYHHGSLPEAPQEAGLALIRAATRLPLVAAGRMGDFARATRLVDKRLADAVALGRPLVADPDLPAKWHAGTIDTVMACGSCLQGCLARVASGEGLSCIVNPAVGRPPIVPAETSKRVLVVGAGPGGVVLEDALGAGAGSGGQVDQVAKLLRRPVEHHQVGDHRKQRAYADRPANGPLPAEPQHQKDADRQDKGEERPVVAPFANHAATPPKPLIANVVEFFEFVRFARKGFHHTDAGHALLHHR